ncbi:MAG: hypothetical protein IJW30_06010 [Clostridia bacterium]|nr:hypothetical protein [Clostridia bacterium]MBQ9774202.1 hypothetical protein [Clostridia bacterium]
MFNIVRRITDYLVSSVIAGDVSIEYLDSALPYVDRAATRERIHAGITILNKHAAWRWRQNDMESLCYKALLDAALSGDGIFYCWWDPDRSDGQPFLGDIRTDLVDSTNLFVADTSSSDLQSQAYLILSGRAKVSDLRLEALAAGVSKEGIARITSDDEQDVRAGALGSYEPSDTEQATYLIRFFRENGEVVFEKSTRQCLIRRVHTGLRFYPVAYFHWHDAKNSYLGSAPVSDMIANQRYINSAYALAMKHMSDTAFSKIIYDKSRIPEWSNEVGEAIAALGGGNVSDAVSVVGVGEMQEGYLELISDVIENTKSMMSATEAALGDAAANNTSALLTLQNASQIALQHTRTAFYACIGELATIWADMLCTYCPAERMLAMLGEDGQIEADAPDYALLKGELLRATVLTGNTSRYTPATTVSILDKLLDTGRLSLRSYLELLPSGVLTDKTALLKKIETEGEKPNE